MLRYFSLCSGTKTKKLDAFVIFNYLLISAISGQECTDTDIVGSLDHNINIIAAPVDRTFILAGYTVPCSATVVAWEFWYQISGAASATLNPGIWRISRTSDDVIYYTLIRSNELAYNPGGTSDNPRIRRIFNLSDTEQFTVPAESVVGVYSGSAQLLHTDTDNSITVYEFRQNQNSVNSTGTNVHYNIAIRAYLVFTNDTATVNPTTSTVSTVVPVTSTPPVVSINDILTSIMPTTTSDDVPTSNNGDTSSDSGAIIGGVVGGVILLLMITVVLCIVTIRCHRKGTATKENTYAYNYTHREYVDTGFDNTGEQAADGEGEAS